MSHFYSFLCRVHYKCILTQLNRFDPFFKMLLLLPFSVVVTLYFVFKMKLHISNSVWNSNHHKWKDWYRCNAFQMWLHLTAYHGSQHRWTSRCYCRHLKISRWRLLRSLTGCHSVIPIIIPSVMYSVVFPLNLRPFCQLMPIFCLSGNLSKTQLEQLMVLLLLLECPALMGRLAHPVFRLAYSLFYNL